MSSKQCMQYFLISVISKCPFSYAKLAVLKLRSTLNLRRQYNSGPWRLTVEINIAYDALLTWYLGFENNINIFKNRQCCVGSLG